MLISKLLGIGFLILAIIKPAAAQEWTIEGCLEYAKNHNRELLAKHQSVKTSDLEKNSAWAQLVPKVEATAGLDHYWQIPVQVFPGELLGGSEGSFVPVRMGTPWMGNYGVEASLKLVDPQVWQDIKYAALQQQASESELFSLEKTLFKNVRMAFYVAQQEKENLNIAHERYENYQEIHHLISRQFDNGLTDKIAFNQSLSNLQDRKDAWSKAEAALETAIIDLKFWMGYPFEEALPIIEKKEELFVPATEFDATQLPDYKSRQLKAEVARQEYKSTYAGLFPTLHLTSSYSRLSFGESIDFIKQSEWFPSGYVGLQLRVPLFSLNKMSYYPKKQRSLLKEAVLKFENYVEQQKKKFTQEEIAIRNSWKSVLIQQENVKLAQENEQLARKKIENGIIDMVQLKQIQQDLNQAQEKLNNARLDFLKHYVELSYLQNN